MTTFTWQHCIQPVPSNADIQVHHRPRCHSKSCWFRQSIHARLWRWGTVPTLLLPVHVHVHVYVYTCLALRCLWHLLFPFYPGCASPSQTGWSFHWLVWSHWWYITLPCINTCIFSFWKVQPALCIQYKCTSCSSMPDIENLLCYLWPAYWELLLCSVHF